MVSPITILDGPVGTELAARGVPTPLPGWSAHAIESAPEVLASIHRDYAEAGATAHTACTFRTTRRAMGERWEVLARRAVGIVRDAVPAGRLVLGSIAPLEDCYRPDLSPANESVAAARDEHALLARVLADAGCDVLLCETFPHVGEALAAGEAALPTGLPVWISFTGGHRCDLLSPEEVAGGARRAVEMGVEAVLVNCVPVRRTLEFVRAIRATVEGSVRVGAYANAGESEEKTGWRAHPEAPRRYADAAVHWRDAGATIIGGCCGTGPAHVRALTERFAG